VFVLGGHQRENDKVKEFGGLVRVWGVGKPQINTRTTASTNRGQTAAAQLGRRDSDYPDIAGRQNHPR